MDAIKPKVEKKLKFFNIFARLFIVFFLKSKSVNVCAIDNTIKILELVVVCERDENLRPS